VELTFQWGVREEGQMCKELSRIVPDEDHEENKNGMGLDSSEKAFPRR